MSTILKAFKSVDHNIFLVVIEVIFDQILVFFVKNH